MIHEPETVTAYVQTKSANNTSEMRVLKIGIATPEQMRARTIAIARGELRSDPNDPKLWVPSMEALGRLITTQNTILINCIRESKPTSIKELSNLMERKPSNVLRTLRSLEKFGLVKLQRGGGRALQPVVNFDKLNIEMEFISR